MNGLREKHSRCGSGARGNEGLVNLDLTCAADPGIELGWGYTGAGSDLMMLEIFR
jgi:hypothetical protein